MSQRPNLLTAVLACEPTAHCSLRGKEIYSNIVWNPEVDPAKIPSQANVEAKLKELEKQYADNEYQRKRLEEYNAIGLGEQLDMIYHDMAAGKGDKTGEWYKAVNKVKTDNPKPE